MTNAEKINQMSVHEKAQWIMDLQEDNCSCCFYYKKYEGLWTCIKETYTYAGCLKGREKWLREEYKEDGKEG